LLLAERLVSNRRTQWFGREATPQAAWASKLFSRAGPTLVHP